MSVEANPGSGGEVFATDEITGEHYPKTKISWGANGQANDTDISNGKPFPIQLRKSDGTEIGSAAAPIRFDPTGSTTQPVSGTVTANLAAGTNNIGDVDVITLPSLPAGNNNIGDVDIASLPALPSGSNNIGSVDVDSLPSITGTVTANLGSPVVTAGSAAGTTGLHSLGTDGTNARIIKTDSSGELQVDVLTLPALPAGNNNIGDVDVASLPALPAGDNNIGNVDIVSLPALAAGTNNIGDVDVLTLPALPAGNNNIGDVDVASLPAIPAGTNNIGDVDVLTLPAIPAGTNNIGDVDVLTLPAIPAGTNLIGSFIPYTVHANIVSGCTAAITGTSNTEVIAAQGTGNRIYITSLTITNSHATVGTVVEIKDNTTVKHRSYAAPAGGGLTVTFPTPIRCSDNTAVNAANVTTGSNTYVSASGYFATT